MLVAAKTAGAAFTAQQSNYLTLGQQAGVAWFTAQVGSIPDALLPTPNTGTNPTVTVWQSDNAFAATVNYTAQVTTIFHKLFGISYVTLSNTAAAKIVANAYVNVSFPLDNSSSMLIAANSSDITTLQNATANSSTWQLSGNPTCTGSTLGKQGTCKATVNTPAAATGAKGSASFPGSNDFGINGLQGCQCAFACHWQPLSGSTFTTGVTTFSAIGADTLNDCAAMKSLGYTIYVLYTTYFTPPATIVLNNTQLVAYVSNQTGTAYDLQPNLQGCASDPANYAEASDPTDIQNALQSMVKAALNGGARLTL